jgi:hypothetical protein
MGPSLTGTTTLEFRHLCKAQDRDTRYSAKESRSWNGKPWEPFVKPCWRQHFPTKASPMKLRLTLLLPVSLRLSARHGSNSFRIDLSIPLFSFLLILESPDDPCSKLELLSCACKGDDDQD